MHRLSIVFAVALIALCSGCGGGGDVPLDGSVGPDAARPTCDGTGPDADGDGVPDACDICALGADQLDSDLDTVPDACDVCPGASDLVDSDADGVPDGCDICAGGDDAIDADSDGIPAACDVCDRGPNAADADSDRVPDACDACPGYPDGADADTDGVPDGCDVCPEHPDGADADTDGVPDGCDVCALGDDGDDLDADGAPDACDCEPMLDIARPGLSEVCDGVDNDCAGGVDDGLVDCDPGCRPGKVDWDLDGTCARDGRVIYVDGSAAGANDGTSWADAHRTLEAALEDARTEAGQDPLARIQIWVAAGRYYPTRDIDPTSSTNYSFVIPTNTAVIGGFEGTEDGVREADPETNVTALTFDINYFNVAWVVTMRQPGAKLVGLEILPINGAIVISAEGTEMSQTKLGVQNNLISAATGIHIDDGGALTADALEFSGLGYAIEVGTGGALLCRRCLLAGNADATYGGAALTMASGDVTLIDSAVIGNTGVSAFGLGGASGIRVDGGAASLTLINCTVAGNTGHRVDIVGPIGNAGLDVLRGSATVINSVIRENSGVDMINATNVSSSLQGINGTCDPLFADPTTLGGITLGAGSTCIDAGNSTMTSSTIDLLGNARVVGSAVDLGAIETQP